MAVSRFAHKFVAIQPTCREVMDFKKAVSQRVKLVLTLPLTAVLGSVILCMLADWPNNDDDFV
jgi:hypothetical protein